MGAAGYRLRLEPGWFRVTPTGEIASEARLSLRPDDSPLIVTVGPPVGLPTDPARLAALRRLAHRTTVGGHPALRIDLSDGKGTRFRCTLVQDGDRQLLISLAWRPSGLTWRQATEDLERMLATWRWHTPGTPATTEGR